MIIVLGILIFIICFFTRKDEKIIKYYIYSNLPTAINKKIRNSFKEGAENYNGIIGNINDGYDYDETERDNYDLCIPNHIMKRKNKYNRLILYIHGGGWISRQIMNVSELCEHYENNDYISASMPYTIFNNTYNNTNMFRLIDEITYEIKAKNPPKLIKFVYDNF